MRKVLIILMISFVIFNLSIVVVNAQLQGQAKIDSLTAELSKSKQDTNHLKLLNELSFIYYTIEPDKGIEYGEKGLLLAQKLDWIQGLAGCYNSLGVNYASKSDYPKALEYYHKSLKIKEEVSDKKGIAGILNNIGQIYNYQSNYPKALESFHKALKINEEMDNKNWISYNLTNIGNTYIDQSNYTKALEYYHKALKINEVLSNKPGLAVSFGNIGLIYMYKSDYPKALEYYHKALKIDEELNYKSGVARHLSNIGVIYANQSNYYKALDYFQKALKIDGEMNYKSGVAQHLGNIGGFYLKLSQDSVIENSENKLELMQNKEINLNKAIEYSKKSIDICKEIGEMRYQSSPLKNLSEAYFLNGEYKKAFEAFKEYKTLQDSIFSMDKQKEFANLDARRENELKDAEITILQTEKKAQQFQSYLLGGGVIVLLGAFGIAFLRFREKKKLSDKLAIQKNEIENQKSIVEEKNEQIYASITYASTIQHAILPWDSTLQKAFNDILIYYKPKDIVSGDSYWFQEVEGIKFLAVIDCTEHGIPGAMLTVIASTALDDAVLGKRLNDTGQILTYMNEKVTEVLNQRLAENKIRDGMEVALIAIHNEKIQFSGAGRPLYLKNGTMEIIKTDKRGIAGQTDNDEYQFSSVEIEKSENLTLYLTSDGYADQMNEQSKKYSTKRFVALLDSISEKPISEQQEILENEFNSHKGTRSQIDDVTILGVNI